MKKPRLVHPQKKSQRRKHVKRSIFALAVVVPVISLFHLVSIGDMTALRQATDEPVESVQESVSEDTDATQTQEEDSSEIVVDEVPEPPPLTYEDVYAQWATLQSELGRLADRLTLWTNSAQEAQFFVLPSERMALRAQLALSSGNLSGASELIAQTQEILDSAHRDLDAPIDDPSFIPIPAQQIFDTSVPEQIALAFREKQNALNFFDQFERELMSSLSLSLLPSKKSLP